MHHAATRYVVTGLLLSAAVVALSACGSPTDFGITGPSPGMSLSPPPPTQAQLNPDAASVIPGVQTGNDSFTPSILNAPAVPGTFYGSD